MEFCPNVWILYREVWTHGIKCYIRYRYIQSKLNSCFSVFKCKTRRTWHHKMAYCKDHILYVVQKICLHKIKDENVYSRYLQPQQLKCYHGFTRIYSILFPAEHRVYVHQTAYGQLGPYISQSLFRATAKIDCQKVADSNISPEQPGDNWESMQPYCGPNFSSSLFLQYVCTLPISLFQIPHPPLFPPDVCLLMLHKICLSEAWQSIKTVKKTTSPRQ